ILAESMKKAGNVILGHSFDPSEASTVPLEEQKAYYKILWGQPWAQVHKEGTADFKVGDAFGKHDGTVVTGVLPNLTLLADAATSCGSYDATLDADGTVRNAALLFYFQAHKSVDELGGDFFTSLPVQTLRLYEGIKDQATDATMSEVGLVS